MLSKIGSPEWVKDRYHVNSGGVDVNQLRKCAFKPALANPKGAVEVTVSKEAKDLAAHNLKK